MYKYLPGAEKVRNQSFGGLRLLQKISDKIFQRFEIMHLFTQFTTPTISIFLFYTVEHCMHLFCYFCSCKHCKFHRKFRAFVPGFQKETIFFNPWYLLLLNILLQIYETSVRQKSFISS